MSAVKLYPLVSSRMAVGGLAQVAAYGPLLGGVIQNPFAPADQGLAVAETLYVNFVGEAALKVNDTTEALYPGGSILIPPGFTGQVSINAPSTGHRFSGILLQPPPSFTPNTGAFPPAGPVTLTETIPSYLYLQYADDENLMAFVAAFNQMAQEYVDWFVSIGLPAYTGEQITGDLLDWVAAGLYGMLRPSLPSGHGQVLGPFNTYRFNTMGFNGLRIRGPLSYYLTTDDVFKRILTWHLYKGDGKTFNLRWLKRRVMRFLTGEDGGAGQTDQTYQVSVTFGVDNQVNINLQSIFRYARGGALFGAGRFNTFRFNELITSSVSVPVSPLVPIFKAAVESGALELPFQYDWIVNI